VRILNNLRNVYLSSGETEMAARVVALMLEVTPDSKLLWQEMAMLCYRNGEWEAAARALRRYFYLNQQWALAVFDDQGRPQYEGANPEDRQLLLLLHEIEQMRRRLN
jgi:tetratricopeptide (TPR) repeat protein